MSDRKTIVIGSASEPFRVSLEAALKDEPDVFLAAETDDGEQLTQRIPAANPDAVILDPAMNGLCGEELLNRILAAGFRAPVLVPDFPQDEAIQAFLASHPERFSLCPAEPSAILARVRTLPEDADREADPAREQEDRIGGMLQELSIAPPGKGHSYLAEAILLSLRHDARDIPILSILMREVAERHSLSWETVYGVISRKVNSVAPLWPDSLVRKYFGPSFVVRQNRPSTTQVIGFLTERVRMEDPARARETRIGRILLEMGLDPSEKAYFYLQDMAMHCLRVDPDERSGQGELYDMLSERYSVSYRSISSCLSINLRAVSDVWDDQLVERCLGAGSLASKRTPSCFLDAVVERVREEELCEVLDPVISDALQAIGLSEEQTAFRCLREAILLYGGRVAVEESDLPQLYETIAQRRKTDAETVRGVLLKAADAVVETCAEEAAVRWFGPRFPDLFWNPDAESFFWPFLVTLGDRILRQADAPAAGQGEERALPAKRIVLGDPSGSFRAAFAKELRREAPQMRLVGMTDNGNHLLLLIRTVSPDAVVLNPVLRAADGEEVLTCIEALEQTPPVLLSSASVEGSVRELKALLAGGAEGEEGPDAREKPLAADGTGPSPADSPTEPASGVKGALLELEIAPSEKAYPFLLEMLRVALENKAREAFTQQELMETAVERLSVGRTTILTTCRAVIRKVSPRWSDRVRRKYFGFCFAAQKSPLNLGRFLTAVAERLRMQDAPGEPKTRVRQTLVDFGLDPGFRGYQYLLDSIVSGLQSGDETIRPEAMLAAAAERYSVSIGRIVSTIQGVIQLASPLWTDRFMETYFGPVFASLKKVPSPGLLIGVVFRKIRGDIALEDRVSAVLQDLGVSAEQISSRYLLEAVVLYLSGDAVEESELYQAIADRRTVSAETVRGGLEEALESIVTHCDTETAIRYFGPGFVGLFYPDDGELAVLPFLAGIADRIREKPSSPSAEQSPEEEAIAPPSEEAGGGSGEEGRSAPEAAPAVEAEDGDQLLKLIDILKPEAIVLKPARNDGDNRELQNRIRAEAPGPFVVFFATSHGNRIEDVLLELNIPSRRKGFSYLRDAILLVSEHPEESLPAGELYTRLGERNGITASTMQHMILALVHDSLEKTSDEVLDKYFGATLAAQRRLSCSEFITMLAGWVRLERTAERPDERDTGPAARERATDRTRQEDSAIRLPACGRVIIATPSDQVRARYEEALRNESGFTLCGGTGDGDQLLNLIASVSPDAVVLDPVLNGLSGQALLDRIGELERVPVVLLSALTPEMRIEAVLTELNLSSRKKGFSYLRDGIILLYRDKERELSFGDVVSQLAEANGITVSGVMQRFSASVSAIWKSAGIRIREKYFGAAFASRKTIGRSCFIAVLALWLRLEDSPEARESVVERAMLDLGLDPSISATWRYTRDIILRVLDQDADTPVALSRLCSMIAKEYSVNGDKVWKAISRGIENARALWTDEIGTKYFGPAYDAENPLTPSQIIPMIADRIRQSTTAPDPA